MRIWIKFSFLVTLAAVSALAAAAQSSQPAPPPDKPHRAELALSYDYIRSNAPPGSCTCFNLNGGSATLAWPVNKGGFAIAADLTIVNTNSSSTQPFGLGLGTFTVGPRYLLRLHHPRFQPYGQVLVGPAHAVGSLVRAPNPGAQDAGLAFAANLGGGADVRLSHRFSWRIAEADYLLTTFDNGSNNHQNNLRVSSGLVIRF